MPEVCFFTNEPPHPDVSHFCMWTHHPGLRRAMASGGGGSVHGAATSRWCKKARLCVRQGLFLLLRLPRETIPQLTKRDKERFYFDSVLMMGCKYSTWLLVSIPARNGELHLCCQRSCGARCYIPLLSRLQVVK